MSKQVSDLQSAVSALTAQVSATVANEAALKHKLDAALADNVAKAAQIGDLQTQLNTALANQSDPTDAAAIQSATSTILAQNQALADAVAVNSPSN